LTTIDIILQLIKENELSNTKVTSDLNLPNSAISEWKKGKAKPSTDAIKKLADYFGVSTDYLLCRPGVYANNVLYSAVAQGENSLAVNEYDHAATYKEMELLRIFRLLGVKEQNKIMNVALELENDIME